MKEHIERVLESLRQKSDLLSFSESAPKERPYVVVHAKKGTHETHATSSYEAAKRAAAHWKLKSTAGIDSHLADVKRIATEEVDLEEGNDPYVSSWNKSLVKRIKSSKHPEHVKTNLLAKAKKSKSASDAELVHQELDKMHEEVNLDEKVLATHKDVTVHRGGEEGSIITVKKGGKEIAKGDYDHDGGGFWLSHHSHKGQKSFDTPDEIAKHYHAVHKEEVELEEGLADVGKKIVAKATNSDLWHEKMRAKYGKPAWDTYWKKNRDKGILNKVLNTGFKEEVEQMDEARNTYKLYDDHKDFAKAHADIDSAVKNAHNDPTAVKKAMRKHAKVGAEDSQSRDTIHASIKRRHGAEVARKTKIGLFEAIGAKDKQDEGEYGYEGDMAMSQLRTIIRNCEEMMKVLKKETDLPEWVQSKITLATDYLQTANDYLMSELEEEVEQIDEGSMDDMNLSQLMKKHAHHHEIGGGSDRSYKALDAIEKHVKNIYGQKAHDKLVKSTEDHAHSAGGPPKHHKESVEQVDEGTKADIKAAAQVGRFEKHNAIQAAKAAGAPFKGPYKDAKGDVQDKSGAKHTAMSRAKHLAKMAAKKNAKLKEAVSDATTPTQAQATVAGKMSSLAQSIKSKKKTGKDEFDANPEFVSQVQPNASNY